MWSWWCPASSTSWSRRPATSWSPPARSAVVVGATVEPDGSVVAGAGVVGAPVVAGALAGGDGACVVGVAALVDGSAASGARSDVVGGGLSPWATTLPTGLTTNRPAATIVRPTARSTREPRLSRVGLTVALFAPCRIPVRTLRSSPRSVHGSSCTTTVGARPRTTSGHGTWSWRCCRGSRFRRGPRRSPSSPRRRSPGRATPAGRRR